MLGSVPTTTYGENIGVMAMTGVYSVRVIAGAAVLSIICSFIGKLSALISTIPGPVIGGISFLLYGMIGTSGLRILVDSKVDFAKSRGQHRQHPVKGNGSGMYRRNGNESGILCSGSFPSDKRLKKWELWSDNFFQFVENTVDNCPFLPYNSNNTLLYYHCTIRKCSVRATGHFFI